jgi:hypothetical protein
LGFDVERREACNNDEEEGDAGYKRGDWDGCDNNVLFLESRGV